MGGIKLCRDISQLDLEAGCSLEDIIAAMPINSIAMLYCNATDHLITDVPHEYGCLQIYKSLNGNRIACKFWNIQNGAVYNRIYNNNKFVSDWLQSISNADLAQPFLPLGADNNHWGGFDITISNNEYLRFQINSSGRIELARYTNNSLNGVKVISDAGWT